jgi:septum formation protein
MEKGFIYLASASPRRRELLAQIGVPFRVRVPAVVEGRVGDEPAAAYVERVAGEKADRVWAGVSGAEPAPVLAADTAVVVDDAIYGKPADEAEALAMLARLSGRSHRVLTAVVLRAGEQREARVAASEVRFRTTSATERLAYCRTGEPFDKAGGYAIQGFGAVFVTHLVGSYSAVMGLPLAETAELLAPLGQPPWLGGAGPGR